MNAEEEKQRRESTRTHPREFCPFDMAAHVNGRSSTLDSVTSLNHKKALPLRPPLLPLPGAVMAQSRLLRTALRCRTGLKSKAPAQTPPRLFLRIPAGGGVIKYGSFSSEQVVSPDMSQALLQPPIQACLRRPALPAALPCLRPHPRLTLRGRRLPDVASYAARPIGVMPSRAASPRTWQQPQALA